MKKVHKIGRLAALLLSVSLATSVLSGCGKAAESSVNENETQETTKETSKKSKKGRKSEATGDKSEVVPKEETENETENENPSDSEEESEWDRQVAERIEEYKVKLANNRANTERMMEYTRMDVQADFLQTLQYYYMSTDSYTTEESTIGDLITSTVADSICSEVAGGSSTVSTALVTAANGIQAGDAPGEIVVNTFVDAMAELPNEITTRVYDYLLGETVFKALDVFSALTTNRQLQHLTNLVDIDIRNDIRELSHICSKEELTLEDCYKGMALADSILQKTYEIEVVMRVNAGSAAWRPYYQKNENGENYGNFITSDLNEIAWAILELERKQQCEDILDSLEHVEKATAEEVRTAFEHASVWPSSNIDELEEFIKSVYDWNDSGDRSQDTKLWNVANALLGNPLTNIALEHYNQQEGRFADALAEFNSEAHSIWLEQYIPLKCKLAHFNAAAAFNDGSVVDTMSGGEDDIDHAIAMAYLKAQLGEELSLDSFIELHKEQMAQMYDDLYAIFESTRILYDTYYVALIDSESNTVFLNRYRFALRTLNEVLSLCPQPETSTGEYPSWFTYRNESCVKIGEAAKKLMDFYIENNRERSDITELNDFTIPNDEGIPITCTLYIKSPANALVDELWFAGCLHREGFQDIWCYNHGAIYSNSWVPFDYFWIQDGNSGANGHITLEQYPWSDSHWKPSNADRIPDDLLVLMDLRGVPLACREVWTALNEPMLTGVPLLFEITVDSARENIQKVITRNLENAQQEEERKNPFLDIQARVESREDTIWTKPEELEQLYIEKYIRTNRYQELLRWGSQGISDEPEGFGTLTCIQPLTVVETDIEGHPYTKYQSVYETGGGKELLITITQCWYRDDKGNITVLDFFVPHNIYNRSFGLMGLSPVEEIDVNVLTILDS